MSETGSASSKRATHTHKRRAAGGSSQKYNSILITLSVSVISFYAGTLWTMQFGIENCDSYSTNPHKLDANVEQLAQARLLGTSVRNMKMNMKI
jgi:hypothetical protein